MWSKPTIGCSIRRSVDRKQVEQAGKIGSPRHIVVADGDRTLRGPPASTSQLKGIRRSRLPRAAFQTARARISYSQDFRFETSAFSCDGIAA
jgi:hypothetical protein